MSRPHTIGELRAHLLLRPQSEKTDTRDLDDLEADTRNITLGLAATTEARDEDLVVLIDEVQAAVILHTPVNLLFRKRS